MYLQITTKCNMACDHCCFKCEPGKGEHMSREVFDAAMDMFGGESCNVIGGGEPTMHPDFEHILLTFISKSEGEYDRPFMVTNGTNKRMSLLLHKLSKAGVINCHLSTDSHHDHDMVSDEVREAFGWDDWDCDKNANGPATTGRWAETNESKPCECACSEPLIQPDGNIRMCGCLDAPIVGNVWDGIEDDRTWDVECFRELD